MASVSRLRVQSVRSHTDYTLELSPYVTVITGQNGSGKTTLIEAMYIALRGSSFKGSDSDVLQSAAAWWRIDVTFHNDDQRSVTYDTSKAQLKKQFLIDNKKTSRLSAKGKYPVVLFEPDDLRLLTGSPARRRQFIDRFIAQIDAKYTTAINKYERALRQRNALLKQRFYSADSLFAWDIALAEYGSYIITQRTLFINRFNEEITRAYQKISSTDDTVAVQYSQLYSGDIKQKLINELYQHRERDMVLGNTSVGPHRHDLVFTLNGSPANSTASRGETRTIVLALKFIEVSILEEITGAAPVILLDDVFSELDQERQKALSTRTHNYQVVMTSTHIIDDYPDFNHVVIN